MDNLLRTFMGSGIRPWLRTDGSERLFTLRLKGVESPLDPDPFWESHYSGGSSIYNEKSKSHNRRLKAALDAHRKLSAEIDEFEFPIEKMLVFSDVVMWLPEKIWNSSSREGGERLFMLSEKLKYRHRTDFGNELFMQRQPHYAIMPLKNLPQDEVIFQFGLGVYLPRENDKQTAEVKILQAGKEPEPLNNWIFFENKQEIERPSALYSEQYFLLIGNTLTESAIQSPVWFSQEQGFIMVDTHRQPNRIYGDDEYIVAGQISGSQDATICPFQTLDNNSQQEALKLLIQRKHDNTHRGKTFTSSQNTTTTNKIAGETVISTDISADPLAGLTVISTNKAPEYVYHLTIKGIVLPRIDISAIKHWQIMLDNQGMPIESDTQAEWIIRGNQQSLEWSHADTNKQEWKILDINSNHTLPFPIETPLTSRLAPLQNKQHGILLLPQALAYPLSHKTKTLGRNTKNDIVLQLINHPESIEWQHKTKRKQSMGHLGLSAHHLSLQIKGQSLQIQQQSMTSPVYILQDNMITQTLKAKSYAETTIKSSQEIIVGIYLLQYNKEYLYDQRA